MGAKMLKFPIPERQEINLGFKIKVFVGSKIWYFNKFYLFLNFQKFGLLHVPMPHMNPSSGAPPMLDEFKYSYWKSACVLILGVFVWGFGELSRMGSLPLMRNT
jgi:hypothetical protein